MTHDRANSGTDLEVITRRSNESSRIAFSRCPARIDHRVPSLQAAIGELERVFLAASSWFSPQKLPPPVITIQSKGRMKALGWFEADRWQNGEPGRLPEINLCAEDLGRDILDIAETLIHELVHYANALDGIRDCSSNQYHNRKFRARAEAVGLRCERSRRGWAHTSLSHELRTKVERLHIDPEAFRLFRIDRSEDRGGAGEAAEIKEPKLRRWECRCGPIRVGRAHFRARCLECGEQFVQLDGRDLLTRVGITVIQASFRESSEGDEDTH